MADAAIHDVSCVLSFGREKLVQKTMFMAGIGGGVGIVALVLADDDMMMSLLGLAMVALCLGVFGSELWKSTQEQKPLLVLTPVALFMRIEGVTEFAIQWSEMRGVDRIDIEDARGAVHKDVTVVVVDRVFYDRVIHVDSFLWRGPGWERFFVPLGDDRMQVGLHHTFLPVAADDLFAAVEARYHTFGTTPAA